MDPSDVDLDRIDAALGWRPRWWRHRGGERGSSGSSARWVVGTSSSRAFVKLGATPLTAEWFRREHATYQTLRGPFIPRLLGFADDGVVPTLGIEDLSEAEWPPPWSDARIDQVRESLRQVHRTPPPPHVGPVPYLQDTGWSRVARSPEAFLALGLCTRDWLLAAIGDLATAASRAPINGDALIHLDVRSDNLCFRDGTAILVDWVAACLGNPDLDIAFWLPSLHAEGGPPPETILPDAPELAAWVAGFFCSGAGEPPIPDAPHVRPLQLMQARTALPWAARALGLPPLP